jgi:hypothetical protein
MAKINPSDLEGSVPFLHSRLRSAGLASITDVKLVSQQVQWVKDNYPDNDDFNNRITEVIALADENARASFTTTLKLYASKDYAEAIRTQVLDASTRFTNASISELERVVATKDFALAIKEEAIRAAVKDSQTSAEALIKITTSAYASRDYVEAKKVEAISASLGTQLAAVIEEREARVAADGRMSGKWSLQTIAGDVVSGIELVSAVESAGRTVSRFRVFADNFEIMSSADGLSGVKPFTVNTATGVVTINGLFRVNGRSILDIEEKTRKPPLAFIGTFASAPDPELYAENSVYRNSTNGNTYVLNDLGVWALYLEKGVPGTAGNAIFAQLSAPAQVFKAPSSGVYSPATITLTAELVGEAPDSFAWHYWDGAAWILISGATLATYEVASGSFTQSRTFRVTITYDGGSVTDEMTLAKLIDGVDGVASYVSLLSNQTVSIATANDGTPSPGELGVVGVSIGKAFTDVAAFKGITTLTATNSAPTAGQYRVTITGQTGGTFAKWSASRIHCTGISDPYSAQCELTVDCEGTLSLIVRFSVSKAKAGAPGAPGDPGSAAVSLTVSAPEQVFKSADGITYTPASITLTATLNNATPSTFLWEYLNAGSWVAAGSSGPTFVVSNSSFTSARTFRCSATWPSGGPITDTITIAKLTDGANGAAGVSPYATLLTNEAHTAGYDENDSPYSGEVGNTSTVTLGKAFTDVLAYKGTTALAPVASSPGTGQFSITIANQVDGGFAVWDTNTVHCLGINPTKGSAKVDIVFNLEGVTTVTKVFTVGKSRTGAGGTRGSRQFFGIITDRSFTHAKAVAAMGGLTPVPNDVVTLTQFPAPALPETAFSVTCFYRPLNFTPPITDAMLDTQWLVVGSYITGNMLVNGTIGAEALSATALFSKSIDVGSGYLRTRIDSTGFKTGNIITQAFNVQSADWNQELTLPWRDSNGNTFNADGWKLSGGGLGTGITFSSRGGNTTVLSPAGLSLRSTDGTLAQPGIQVVSLTRDGTRWLTPNNFRSDGVISSLNTDFTTMTATTAKVATVQKAIPDGWTPTLFTGTNSLTFSWTNQGLVLRVDGTYFLVGLTWIPPIP